jgi:hypothetical protein
MGFRIHPGRLRPKLAALAAGVLVLVATAVSPAPAATAATTTPNSGQFYGISCPSAKWCTAVGTESTATTGPFSLSLGESWDGKTWSRQPTPTPPNTAFFFLNGVSCTSRDFCMAVGWAEPPQIGMYPEPYAIAEVWNGSKWALQRPPTPLGSTGISLNGVSCTSPTFCVAAGYLSSSIELGMEVGRLIEMWNGKTWSMHSPIPTNGFSEDYAVSCTSPAWCVATGERAVSAGIVTAAYAWDGTSWSFMHTPSLPPGPIDVGPQLDGISCTSPRACTAVGYYGNPSHTIAERWNGSSWTLQHSTSAKYTVLSAVSCRSPAACNAVGYSSDSTLAERWNGKAWSTQHMPTVTNGRLAGISCPTPCQCSAVGADSTQPGTLAEIWNGRTWSQQTTPGLGSS